MHTPPTPWPHTYTTPWWHTYHTYTTFTCTPHTYSMTTHTHTLTHTHTHTHTHTNTHRSHTLDIWLHINTSSQSTHSNTHKHTCTQTMINYTCIHHDHIYTAPWWHTHHTYATYIQHDYTHTPDTLTPWLHANTPSHLPPHTMITQHILTMTTHITL